ncbi:MAG: hypothetical protein ACRC80_08575 [Waterburya sp.]
MSTKIEARQKILESFGAKSIQISLSPRMLLMICQWAYQAGVIFHNKIENTPMLKPELDRTEEALKEVQALQSRIKERFDIPKPTFMEAFDEEID